MTRILEMKLYHGEELVPAALSANLNFPGSPPGLSVRYNVTGASPLECDSIANVPATTADHVVENVVRGLNLIRILRVDDEIVELRTGGRSRARARTCDLKTFALHDCSQKKDWIPYTKWMKKFMLL